MSNQRVIVEGKGCVLNRNLFDLFVLLATLLLLLLLFLTLEKRG